MADEGDTDAVPMMEAFIAYLTRRGFTTRAEQAFALNLSENGTIGEVTIARYLATGRAMRHDVLKRALVALKARVTYDGTTWTVEDAA